MYEKFTDRAKQVMQMANIEAQHLNHEHIETGHILLGIVRLCQCGAVTVLHKFDVGLGDIRREVEKIMQSGPDMMIIGKLPQTPRAKKAIEYAMEEARNLNHNYVGTEHLLLGLLRERYGVAAQVLMNLGLKLEDAREEVMRQIGESPSPESQDQGEKQAVKEPFKLTGTAILSLMQVYCGASRYLPNNTATKMLVNEWLLAEDDPDYYRTTDRGRALINMLCSTPLPESAFVDPRTNRRKE